MNRPFAIIMIILISFSSFAKVKVEIHDTYIGLGGFTQFFNDIQIDQYGGKNKVKFTPFINLGFIWAPNDTISFNPEIGITLFDESRDEYTTRSHAYINSSVGYKLKMFHPFIGVGFFMTNISGDGGVETLDNGNSSTDFPLPAESSRSYNFSTIIGLEIFASENFSIKTQAFLFNLFEKLSANEAFLINVAYHWDPL